MLVNEKLREENREWNSKYACVLVCEPTDERKQVALEWQANNVKRKPVQNN